jgi:hypothetical protein
MEMLAGTSGYSYKEWLGRFYPERLPAAEMLEHSCSGLRNRNPACEFITSSFPLWTSRMTPRSWRARETEQVEPGRG